VQLGDQPTERLTMPFYTTLKPKRPIRIPGKGSHLGLWVRAASDWGRVVYCLRDAKGERWLSVGSKQQWNCDDTSGWSVFNFDGWRYLRFPLPANSPYDLFREDGSVWWGHYGSGDGVVDLPLALEQIHVERRTHTIYVNDIQPANREHVLLADLFVEYAAASDRGRAAERLSRVRMPAPKDVPDLGNPLLAIAEAGTASAPPITRLSLHNQLVDGTRCYLHFEPAPGAKHYDIWVSPYADGQGALQLGKKWAGPGKMITGLRPDTDFYAFVVVTAADGKRSKPSAPFKIRLKDMFGMK
jgi:hypothetical protein